MRIPSNISPSTHRRARRAPWRWGHAALGATAVALALRGAWAAGANPGGAFGLFVLTLGPCAGWVAAGALPLGLVLPLGAAALAALVALPVGASGFVPGVFLAVALLAGLATGWGEGRG